GDCSSDVCCSDLGYSSGGRGGQASCPLRPNFGFVTAFGVPPKKIQGIPQEPRKEKPSCRRSLSLPLSRPTGELLSRSLPTRCRGGASMQRHTPHCCSTGRPGASTSSCCWRCPVSTTSIRRY